ncbi:group III truncated hemoglobin [Marinirhabdus gelatinilytica]|uniref:Hemoglobin n=1 Tax=Marinirhabdus gelatinilytica TaxID=1703343 RepID=A0A370QLH1_9FLAO|nr:group III truncated hemoglobin [Marinirhabdus gelatinilytica]RDK89181.1 hemoglobin [Marinirhabdus gelatinilytica]
MKEIKDRKDIEIMVDTFYTAVRKDDLLGPIFNGIIKDNWSQHLDTMYRFWQTVLLHEYAYKGSPFMPHRKLPINEQHFDRWLQLFKSSIDENFKGKAADEAKWRAEKMAEMFLIKLNNKSF